MKNSMDSLQGGDIIDNITYEQSKELLKKVRKNIPDMNYTYYTRDGISTMVLMGKRITNRESITLEYQAIHPDQCQNNIHPQHS
jgi:hypothetical protein